MTRDLTIAFTFKAQRLTQTALAAIIVAIPPNLMSQLQAVNDQLSATFPAPAAVYQRLVVSGLEGPSFLAMDPASSVGIGLPEAAIPAAKLTVRQPAGASLWNSALVFQEDAADGNWSALYQSGPAGLRASGVIGSNEAASGGFNNGGLAVGGGWASGAALADGLSVQGDMRVGVTTLGPANAQPSLVVGGPIGDSNNPGCEWVNIQPLWDINSGGCTAAKGAGWTVLGWEVNGLVAGAIASCVNDVCTDTFTGRILCCRISS